jgi:hypothetical protein
MVCAEFFLTFPRFTSFQSVRKDQPIIGDLLVLPDNNDSLVLPDNNDSNETLLVQIVYSCFWPLCTDIVGLLAFHHCPACGHSKVLGELVVGVALEDWMLFASRPANRPPELRGPSFGPSTSVT